MILAQCLTSIVTPGKLFDISKNSLDYNCDYDEIDSEYHISENTPPHLHLFYIIAQRKWYALDLSFIKKLKPGGSGHIHVKEFTPFQNEKVSARPRWVPPDGISRWWQTISTLPLSWVQWNDAIRWISMWKLSKGHAFMRQKLYLPCFDTCS